MIRPKKVAKFNTFQEIMEIKDNEMAARFLRDMINECSPSARSKSDISVLREWQQEYLKLRETQKGVK